MLFYFVRHGQTEANAREILAGSGIDHPLNHVGHRQASLLAESVQNVISHPIHRVVSSDLMRARQTAAYIGERFNLEVEFHSGLREWHLGEWEGKSYSEFAHLLLGGGEPKNGESREVFYKRVESAWKSVHSDSDPYIVVSHGAVWLALQDLLRIPRFKINNCDLVRVWSEAQAGQWSAEILKFC